MSARMFSHEPLNFRALPPAIKALITANVAVFLLAAVVGDQFYQLFGLVPSRVISDRWIWQPVSYLFIHGGFMHLLFNLFALWMFGVPVEAQWGEVELLKYFFICGLGAAAASIAMSPHSAVPVIGASGPIYGLLVAFAMLYPDAVIYLYFLIPVKAAHMAILFGLLEFFAGAAGTTPGIARFAHLGGMVTGYFYIRWWWVLKVKAKAVWKDFKVAGISEAPRRRPGARRGAASSEPQDPEAGMAEMDRLLDKILVSGFDSLTKDEREFMRRYSDKSRRH